MRPSIFAIADVSKLQRVQRPLPSVRSRAGRSRSALHGLGPRPPWRNPRWRLRRRLSSPTYRTSAGQVLQPRQDFMPAPHPAVPTGGADPPDPARSSRHFAAGHFLHRVDGLVRKPWYEYNPFCSVEGIVWANHEMPATSVRSHTFLLTVML